LIESEKIDTLAKSSGNFGEDSVKLELDEDETAEYPKIEDDDYMFSDDDNEDYFETTVKKERTSSSQTKTAKQNSESYVKIECFICEEIFLGHINLKQHYKEFHNEVSFECKICGKNQPNIMDYRRHYYKHSEVKKRAPREIKCRLCDEVFLGSHNLKLHYATHGPGPYECPVITQLLEPKTVIGIISTILPFPLLTPKRSSNPRHTFFFIFNGSSSYRL